MQGILIKESFKDDEILNWVTISKTEFWQAENHTSWQPASWTAIYVQAAKPGFTQKLSEVLLPRWYADLRDGLRKIIVLPGEVIEYQIGDAEGRERACRRCLAAGVPPAQPRWGEE
ncbi:hypothetical protein SDC9_189983 [bioreactor metagenome]|uniref:Uncharacterized protein n=1 Tax=bioreactor metagenome TaxID=1076179 RepID=A0A645HV24_9ZZZZ